MPASALTTTIDIHEFYIEGEESYSGWWYDLYVDEELYTERGPYAEKQTHFTFDVDHVEAYQVIADRIINQTWTKVDELATKSWVLEQISSMTQG